MTALIIDDEVQIRRLLRMALETRGYKVHEAEAGQRGLQEAAFVRPDVILLDLGLPDMDGVSVLKRLREWSAVPVLILSVRDQEEVKVAAFEAGADDYVTKPFGTAELLARLAAIQRRQKSLDSPEILVGPLHIDLVHHEAFLSGESLKVTPTEYALLKMLARNVGRLITQKQILREVWAGYAGDAGHSLRVHMTHLRNKLGDCGIEIKNEPGIGYRLVEQPI
ncbi:MAG: operon transcriptional regulatory protein kdpE [Verrucomicrobiaceae bacterium]|nr:operon transcriptional regulatory protein kdpE [Verrucomicrobiaceae bacterium]